MIIYKSVLQQLKSAGYNTTKLRRDKLIPESTIQRIREGKPITTETIDVICALLNCQPGDILAYVPNEEG